MSDFRSAVRQLRKNPGFTVLAVLVLSLAIGGVTAMFSLVNTLIMKPLPGVRPGEIVRVYDKVLKPTQSYRAFSYPRYLDVRERQDAFTQMAAFTLSMVGTEEGEVTKRSFAMLLSSNYFDLLGLRMAHGRNFLPDEEKPGSNVPVVIVGHPYWIRHGADPGMVGGTVRINARDFQVVGIAPKAFTGATRILSSEFFFPLGLYDQLAGDFMGPERRGLDDRRERNLLVIGRLKPGLSMAQAQARLQPLAAQLALAFPSGDIQPAFELGPQSRIGLNTQPSGDDGVGVLSGLILGFALVVLVIACLNLANMLLAKGASRSKEMAIRMALGSQRWQVIRQLLAEGFLLSLVGGVGGFALSLGAMKVLLASLDANVPIGGIVLDPSPDFRIFLGTFVFCLLATLVFALGPAFRLSRPAVAAELKGQSGEAPMVRRRFRWMKPMNLIVVGQVALSLAMLTAAGLFFRGALGAAQANPGFPLERGMLVELDASFAGYGPEQGRQSFSRVLERLRETPGVESASLAYTVPFGMVSNGRGVQRAGDSKDAEAGKFLSATSNMIADAYFRTLGVQVLKGREFRRDETLSADAQSVVIVDQSLADKLWPGEDAIGRWLTFGGKEGDPEARPREVVGIVPTLRDQVLADSTAYHVYTPFGKDYNANAHLHIRVTTGGKGMFRPVREVIRSVDPRLPILAIKTLEMHRAGNLILWFFQALAVIFAIFGLLALFLAAVGLYGVKSQVVAMRTREFGIRMAIGASPGSVQGMVLKEGFQLTLVGLAFGLGLAALTSQVLRSLLYEVKALDPLIFTLGPAILLATAMLASLVPARRASRVHPNDALRGD